MTPPSISDPGMQPPSQMKTEESSNSHEEREDVVMKKNKNAKEATIEVGMEKPPTTAAASTNLPSYGMASPLIHGSLIWGIGLVLFGLAMIWPPLLLVMTSIAATFIPYAFHETDDASRRRYLLHEFDRNDHVSAPRREIPENVRLETGYWTNAR
jgi:hypothetical protein